MSLRSGLFAVDQANAKDLAHAWRMVTRNLGPEAEEIWDNPYARPTETSPLLASARAIRRRMIKLNSESPGKIETMPGTIFHHPV
jgi:hypothetical protein